MEGPGCNPDQVRRTVYCLTATISLTMNTSDQTMSTTLDPSDNSIVQANLTEINNTIHVVPVDPKPAPGTLPDQTPVLMLSRLRQLAKFNWQVGSTGILWYGDLEELLRTNDEHAPILKQYRMYRSDFKLVVRINTNQFYSGAVMVTWWTGDINYGLYRQQRAVLNPVTVSASTQQAAEIDIPFAWPQDFLNTYGVFQTDPPSQKLHVCIEVISPLTPSSQTLPDTIQVQVFGSYRNPVLMFNQDQREADPPAARALRVGKGVTHQSKMNIDTKLKTKSGGETKLSTTFAPSPVIDAVKRGDGQQASFAASAPTLSSIPIIGTFAGALFDLLRIGTSTVKDLAPVASSLAPLVPLLLDKPEQLKDTERALLTVDSDNFCSDVADASTPATYSKQNYCRAMSDSGVKLGTWSLAQYAQIPGLLATGGFTSVEQSYEFASWDGATPLSNMMYRFSLWKGSTKLKVQFFASSFTSARFALSIIPAVSTGPIPFNPDDHIVRIIEVKGDTDVEITIPYVAQTTWWSLETDLPYHLELRLISPITGFDAVTDPYIGYAMWVAGGDDIQFAAPEYYPLDYTGIANLQQFLNPPPLAAKTVATQTSLELLRPGPGKKLPLAPGVVSQTAIQQDFHKRFMPIVDDCKFVVDNGRVCSDIPVTFNDLVKRYYKFDGPSPVVRIDNLFLSRSMEQWLNLFAVYRGGYRVKLAWNEELAPGEIPYAIIGTENATDDPGIALGGWNGLMSLSLPWNSTVPWMFWNDGSGFDPKIHLPVVKAPGSHEFGFIMMSCRDDVELGMPVIPLPDLFTPVRLSQTSQEAGQVHRQRGTDAGAH